MNKKQKETDKFALKAVTWSLIIFITLFILASFIGCNRCKIAEPIDNVMDNIDMDCGGEYHGKEGNSEYGEYDSN